MGFGFLCSSGSNAFDLSDACIRSTWSTLLPFFLVVVLCARAFGVFRLPSPLPKAWGLRGLFRTYLTLSEAEGLLVDDSEGEREYVEEEEGKTTQTTTGVPLWRPFLFGLIGCLEVGSWVSVGCYKLVISASSTSPSAWETTRPFILALTWLYTATKAVLAPSVKVQFDLFAVYVGLLVGALVQLAAVLLYDFRSVWVWGEVKGELTASVVNLLAVLIVLGIVFGMPMEVPSERVDKSKIGYTISPEDYTSLWGWATFSWVYPLVQRGKSTTLQETDVWDLSPCIKSRAVFGKFSASANDDASAGDALGFEQKKPKKKTLLRRLWEANSFDICLDASLTMVSVSLGYFNPFFLNQILTSITPTTPNAPDPNTLPTTPPPSSFSLQTAYTSAILMFVFSLLKAECDLQHLWFGRRGSTRVREELMVGIYEKALRRRGGVRREGDGGVGQANGVSEEASGKKGRKEKRKGKEEKDNADDPKQGADVGKIVNLMAGDANKISQVISGLYFIYGAPLEIIIGCTYLYQLLGLSAFVGFLTLLLGWPLNTYLAKRSIRINKGTLSARDKRMSVVSEGIGGVKFIKFFAWEEKWIERVMDARGYEMGWMVKARINSVLFSTLWMSAPILVSVISFWAYVAQGNVLTVSKAFTAIALFGMIRAPLNVIPTWIVQILQTKVALDRISVYLDEEEVDECVSSLMGGTRAAQRDRGGSGSTVNGAEEGEVLPGGDEDEVGLGLVNATLKWNEVTDKEEEKKEGDDMGKANGITNGNGHGHDASSSTSTSASTSNGGTPHVLEHTASSTSSYLDGEVVDGEAGRELEVEDHRFELRDISVMFPEGQLTVVTGPTASGKTALLLAVLGEMTLLSGQLILRKNLSQIDSSGLTHSISYAAQTPWLRHQSIKDNILFGYPLDEERYREVVKACALKPDFEMLEDGDNTEIGARGVSLSGGQKARVALARAVYARTKYVLLDDPLSAVDSHTSRYLFENLLCGPLLQNRTVVLVTHHVDLVLPGAYYLVRMLDGRIETQGTVKDLLAQGVLTDIVMEAEVDAREEEMVVADAIESAVGDATEGDGDSDLAQTGEDVREVKKPRKLVKEEHREVGGVKWVIYKKYLKASSYWIWVLLAFLVIVNQVLGVSEKLWIKTWGRAYQDDSSINTTFFKSFSPFRASAVPEHELSMDGYILSPEYVIHHVHSASSDTGVRTTAFDINWPNASEHPLFYVGIYAAIGLANVLVNVLAITAQYTGALRASRVLFKQLLVTVVRATFRFHDTTPQGRLLNRFGKDIETIDSSLASSLQAVNSSLASFFASIITVAVVFPLFLLPAALIGTIYRELAIGYLNTGRDLRRMESNSRSPIFSDFAEILEGIVTVRAFSAEKRFLDNLYKKIDTTTKMWYGFWMTNRWLLFNFDILGSSAVFITALFSISKVDAGLAGLCITSALSFTGSVYWACRFWTGLELDLNSVERIVEYLDLPQEPPAIIESHRPPAYWPSASRNDSLISVENLVIKYAPELPAVLQDVSFTLKAGERIGLLGRTGSGKSTLAMSILRFVDPTNGRIIIDGIDISTIGVHDLRSRLTFIPQDATLFSGTLRDNLDPFGEHTDAECMDVLYRVQMIGRSQATSRGTSRAASTVVSPDSSRPPSIHGVDREDTFSSIGSAVTDVDPKTTVSLDTQVSPGGANFSQGQRQLIAMARALLRRSSIIVLDEATSSIDFATDAKIQATIREEFTDSLLLTIAHRLRTIVDYDRLLVLDKGRVVEFDTPLNLIQKEGGVFRSMCMKSGTFAELEASAKAKLERS